MRARIARIGELSASERAAWLALRAAEPAYDSPFLHPGFAEAVEAGRPDARVAVFEDGGRIGGFLPHHRRNAGLARPIGTPLSDSHGPVLAPWAAPVAGAALVEAGVHAFAFAGLVDPHGAFSRGVRACSESHVVDLSEGLGGYADWRRSAHKAQVKSLARRMRRAETLRFVADDRSAEAFDTLVAWKRDQLRRTRRHDFLAPQWVRTLLARLRAEQDHGFGGVVFSLRDEDRIVAVEFGLRAGGVYHSWFPAFDRAYAELSPGLLLLEKMIEAAPVMGLHKIDLGPGESHYKKYYSNRLTPLYEGLATGSTGLGRAHAGGFTLWRSLEAAPLGARLRRRLDQIAACEPTAVGRVRGVIAAAGALRAA